MIGSISYWIVGVILDFYPFALAFVLFFHLSKSLFKGLDRSLILQIINVWTAIAALAMIFWLPDFSYYSFGDVGEEPEFKIDPDYEWLRIIHIIFSITSILLPQIFWIKQIRKNIWISILVMIICSKFLFEIYYSYILDIDLSFSNIFYFRLKEEVKFFVRHNIPSLGFYVLIVLIPYYKIVKSAKYKVPE